MDKNSFSEQCYSVLKRVPKGKVTTYQDIAHKLGSKAYRAVGNAMNRNPYAPKVPCHRVVRNDGSIGGFAHGPNKKIAMLRREGVTIRNGKVDLDKCLYKFR